LAGEARDDGLVQRVRFASQVLVPAHQFGETVTSGGKANRELVHGGGSRRLRTVLNNVKRFIQGLLERHDLLPLRLEQHGKCYARLRAAARNHSFHQRQGVRGPALRLI